MTDSKTKMTPIQLQQEAYARGWRGDDLAEQILQTMLEQEQEILAQRKSKGGIGGKIGWGVAAVALLSLWFLGQKVDLTEKEVRRLLNENATLVASLKAGETQNLQLIAENAEKKELVRNLAARLETDLAELSKKQGSLESLLREVKGLGVNMVPAVKEANSAPNP